MKKFVKILVILAILTAVFCGAANMFISVRGKVLVIQKLEELTHKQVTMNYLVLIPPLNLQAKNVHIESIGRVDSVFLSPSIIGLLTGHLVFNQLTLVKPQFAFEKVAPPNPEATPHAMAVPFQAPNEKTQVVPEIAAPKASQEEQKPEIKKNPFIKLAIKHLDIRNGVIDFTDRSISKEGMKIKIQNINIDVDNFYNYPVSAITNFDITGKVPWHAGLGEGTIDCQGWLNLFKKDIQAKLKITDIDGVAFYPYYSSWINLEKTRIQKAKLNFVSNIQGLNNEVSADCRFELTELTFKKRSIDEQQQNAEKIANTVLDMLRSLNKGNIVLDFKYKTTMDHPKFTFSDIKMAFEEKISKVKDTPSFQAGEMAKIPGKVIEGTVKSATDITKAIISGTAGVGKELKNAVTGAFSKEGTIAQPEPQAQEQAAPAPSQAPEASQQQTASQPAQQQQGQQPAQQQEQPANK